jgi:hypothetical protein
MQVMAKLKRSEMVIRGREVRVGAEATTAGPEVAVTSNGEAEAGVMTDMTAAAEVAVPDMGIREGGVTVANCLTGGGLRRQIQEAAREAETVKKTKSPDYTI